MSTQTQITKTKEVWRDAKGHFAPEPKPVKVVTPEPEPESPDAVPVLMLLGGTTAVLAVVYWQVTLTLALLAGAAYALRWHLKREKLVINNYWGG